MKALRLDTVLLDYLDEKGALMTKMELESG